MIKCMLYIIRMLKMKIDNCSKLRINYYLSTICDIMI